MSTEEIGVLMARLEADHAQLDRALKEAERNVTAYTRNVDADVRTAERHWQRLGSVIQTTFNVAAVAAAAATAAIGYQIGKSIKDATDLTETISKVNTVFGSSSGEMLKWSQNAATSMGLSKQAALDAAGTIGNMFVQLGADAEIAAKTSQQMVQLSSDIASFHNVSGGAVKVLEDMQSAFRGEYDPIQKYVPAITAAAVQHKALAESGKKSADQLTALDKVLATQEIMFEQAGVAVGDFARTSGDVANQQRQLQAQMEDLRGELGQHLLPATNKVLTTLNEWLEVNKGLLAQDLGGWIGSAADKTLDFAEGLGKVVTAISKIPEPVLAMMVGAAVGGRAGKYGALAGALGGPFVLEYFKMPDTEMEKLEKQLEGLSEYWNKLLNDPSVDPAKLAQISNAIIQVTQQMVALADNTKGAADETNGLNDAFGGGGGAGGGGGGLNDNLDKAAKALEAFANQIKQEVMTPAEQYHAQLVRLDEALAKSKLTQEEYNRAVFQAKDAFDSAQLAAQEAADWSDYYAHEMQLFYENSVDENEIFTDEVIANNQAIEDSTYETWQACGDIVHDFFDRVRGEGGDLVNAFDDYGKRIAGALLGDLMEVSFNVAFGLPTGTTGTEQVASLALNSISSGSGMLGSIPGLPSVASSAMSFLGMGATTAALDASSIATLAMAGVIDPATAQMMMAELAPTATGFGAQSMQFLNSYGIYGAAGSIGYSLLAQPLGLPYNEPALAGIGAGAGAMIGQALIPIPGVGAVIGATLGGIFGGSLGGADHEARRDERGVAWLEAFTGLTSIADLSDLTAAMPESWGGLPYESRDDTAAKVQYAGWAHTVLESQMTKSDYDATLAHFDDMAAAVADTLDEQGTATEATAAALAEYRDEIELTALYMEDWGHDAQAAGQALIAFYGTLSAGAIEDYFSEVYTGAMSLAEAMALLNDMGMTPLEASTAAVAQALSDLLGVTAETSGSIAEMYDVLLASLEAQADYNLYAADMAAIQTALTSGYEFTEEELGILVYYYQQLEAVLAGDIEVTEEFINAQTLANGVIQDASGYWDALALSIENAQLRLQGFADLDTSTMAMLERYVIPDLMATTGPANPDEPSIGEIPTGQSILNAYGSPGAALAELSWLPEWYKTASDTDIQWMAQHYYPELEVDAAVNAFTADILWLDEQFKKTAEDQIAIQQQLEDQYTSIANSLQADIMQATLSPQDYARYQLGTSYQGHQAGIDALRAAGVSEEALQPLQDLLDYWYEIQLDAINKQYLVSEQFGLTISELESLAGSWQGVLDNIQNTQLSLLTGIANPADAFERLGIARSAIDQYTGGMSIDSYLASLSPEEQISAASDLQGLFSDYLAVAQEAYERPSPEYQQIFDEVISGLGTLEDYASDQLSAIEIDQQQLSTLQSIEAGVWTLAGSGEVSAEATNSTPIVSPESSKSDTGGNVVIEINVTATGSPEDNAKTIVNEVTRWARSGLGRTVIQRVARGY